MNYNEIKDLIEILNVKLKILKDIHILTCEQTEKLNNEDIDGFIKILDRKDLRIKKIKELDKKYNNQLIKVKEIHNVDDLSELKNNKSIKEIENLQVNIQNTLKNIYIVDNMNKEKFDIEFNKVKDTMRNLKKGKKVTSSYYKIPTQVGGYFIDNKK